MADITQATPLASEQITQEDREAAADLRGSDGFRLGYYDHTPLVQAFARHRIAALSASPAPSGQGVSVPEGMKPWGGGDSAPDDYDPTGDVMLRDGERCKGADGEPYWDHGFGDADVVAYTPKPAPAPSCAPGEVERLRNQAVTLVLQMAEAADKPMRGVGIPHNAYGRAVIIAERLAALAPSCAPGEVEKKWPGLSCVTSDEDVSRIADVPDTEIPTPVQAVRWLAKFSNPDEVASTTPRKIANELANICALLTLSPQGLDAKEGGFTKEWCLKMAQLEAGQEIGAGMPDHPLRRPETEGN